MDLNRDLRSEYGYDETFDLVTNLGTGEHVFDQRRVFENVHNLTKPGGVMLYMLPFVNWLNHGFYNFHPVLFADLAAANGYGILEIALTAMPRDLVRAEPAQAAASTRATLPRWTGRSRRVALAYRGIRRVLVREPAPTSIALTDALLEIRLSSVAPDLPLSRALDALMSGRASGTTATTRSWGTCPSWRCCTSSTTSRSGSRSRGSTSATSRPRRSGPRTRLRIR